MDRMEGESPLPAVGEGEGEGERGRRACQLIRLVLNDGGYGNVQPRERKIMCGLTALR